MWLEMLEINLTFPKYKIKIQNYKMLQSKFKNTKYKTNTNVRNTSAIRDKTTKKINILVIAVVWRFG